MENHNYNIFLAKIMVSKVHRKSLITLNEYVIKLNGNCSNLKWIN